MKLFSLVFVALFAVSQAHFDLEKYAKVYRDKRAEYLAAKQELVLAEGPYLASRNAYIASTAVLSNAAIPDTNADPNHAVFGPTDGLVTDVGADDPPDNITPSRRLRSRPKALKEQHDSSGESNPASDASAVAAAEAAAAAQEEAAAAAAAEAAAAAQEEAAAAAAAEAAALAAGAEAGAEAATTTDTGSDQQSTFFADYTAAREHWLDAKNKVASLEGPYLAAREAYVFAAQTYSNSLLPSGIGHLYEPVFNEDNFRPHIHLHTN